MNRLLEKNLYTASEVAINSFNNSLIQKRQKVANKDGEPLEEKE